jgi:hypothetical protein
MKTSEDETSETSETSRKSDAARSGTSEAVDRATTVVRTNTLNETGIDQVRVLSESKFFGLVRAMVEDSLRVHLTRSAGAAAAARPPGEPTARAGGYAPPAPSGARPPPSPLPPPQPSRPVPGTYEELWKALRHQHEQSLDRIESGMRRLASTFEGIRTTLGEREGRDPPRTAPPASHPAAPASHPAAPASHPAAPPPGAARVRSSAVNQKALLREMLLQEPGSHGATRPPAR